MSEDGAKKNGRSSADPTQDGARGPAPTPLGAPRRARSARAASRRTTSGRAGRRTTAAREVRTLTVLLVAIAALLVVAIALLPPKVGDPQPASLAEPVEEPVVTVPAATRSPGGDYSAPDTGGRSDEPRVATRPATTSEPAAVPRATEPVATARALPWWMPVDLPDPALRGRLHLILDDAGNTGDEMPPFLGLPIPFAVAVLPQLPYSTDAARRSIAAGKEVILHQPMEAIGGADPGPGWIGPGHSREQIVATLTANLLSVPGAIGANNHMGSLASSDEPTMRLVLDFFHANGMFYLDSRTISRTVARRVAREVGIPFAERNVFLDNVRERDAILTALSQALELSNRGEDVFMIGHVTVPLLADVLREAVPVLLGHEYEFRPLSTAVQVFGDDTVAGRIRDGSR